jgi:hypothetical protein
MIRRKCILSKIPLENSEMLIPIAYLTSPARLCRGFVSIHRIETNYAGSLSLIGMALQSISRHLACDCKEIFMPRCACPVHFTGDRDTQVKTRNMYKQNFIPSYYQEPYSKIKQTKIPDNPD